MGAAPPVPTATTPDVAGAPTVPPPHETRRVVTVLFTDVVGSTDLGETLDPEAMRRLVQTWFAAARETIERHGGTVEKFIGDAVMAVFGVPVIHEDDALRAVRAAAELGAADRGGLVIRVGVDTGEVVAGDPSLGSTFVTGDAANTAARLQTAADPGQILIGEATYRLTRDAVTVEHVAPLVLKGKRQAVTAHRLITVAKGAEAIARRLDGPMVGRASELARLRSALEETHAGSTPRVVTVIGEPGIGKSRLVHEFLVGARQDAVVIRARCLPYGDGITYLPLRELIRDAAGIGATAAPAEARERITALVVGIENDALVAARLAALAGLGDAVGAPHEIAWAVRRMMEHLSAKRPVVVVVDDIQWAQPVLVDLLEHVADSVHTGPLLLLFMARTEIYEAHPGWMRDRETSAVLRLEPLTVAEGAHLVDGLLGGLPLAPQALARIATAAEGNPLFIEQLLAMLLDDGILARDDGRWVSLGDLEQVAIPPSIAALLAARLDRLAPPERATIERAAVVGKVFWWGALADLAPEPERDAVGGHIATLVRRELVVTDQSTVAGDEAFRFRHLLVRDAAYSGISKADRARLHERFAQWLEQRPGADPDTNDLVLGYHLEQAYRFRTELGEEGDTVRALAERALAHLAPAGEAAFERGDVRTAVPLLRRAVDLAPIDHAGRGRAMYWLARALDQTGEVEEARGLIRRVRETPLVPPDVGLEYRARIWQAYDAFDEGHVAGPELLALAQEAFADAERRGDRSDMLSFLHYTAQATLFVSGPRAEEEARLRLVKLAREMGFEGRADRALGFIANRLPGGPTPVPEGLQRCRVMFEEIGEDLQAKALVLLSMGAYQAMAEEIDAARATLDHAKAIIEEVGQVLPMLAADWPGFVCFVELKAGDAARAEPVARWSCQELERLQDFYHLGSMLLNLAAVLMAQGRIDEVPALIERARVVSPTGDPHAHWYEDLTLAELRTHQGLHQEAVALARPAVAALAATDELDARIDASLILARALRAAGDTTGAVTAAGEAQALAAAKQDTAALRKIDAFLAG